MARRIVDRLTPAHAPLSIFPQPPTLSSPQTWTQLYLEHHCQPAYETPEYCYGWCIVSIHLGSPIVVEKWVEGVAMQCRSVMDGDVGIYPANVRYRERCLNHTEFLDLYLDPNLFKQILNENDQGNADIQPHFAQPDRLIHQMGLALRSELEASGEKLYAEAMAQALAVHLLRHYTQSQILTPRPIGGLAPPQLQQAIDYIQAHLLKELTVAAVAAAIGLSPYHFSRCFKQATGCSPHQYILQQRVDRAKRYLLHSSLSLAEVAYESGFASQSHLNRHFKRIIGTTPRQFRHS